MKLSAKYSSCPSYVRTRREAGFVLIVGLLLMLVLTILGLAAMRGTTLQERMASNMQQRIIAFQAAEAALRAGEAELANAASMPTFDNTAGYYSTTDGGAGDTPRWQTLYGPNASEQDADSSVVTYTGASPAESSYFIEKLEHIVLPGYTLGPTYHPSAQVYRITAEGRGQHEHDGAAVVLQSTYVQ